MGLTVLIGLGLFVAASLIFGVGFVIGAAYGVHFDRLKRNSKDWDQ